MEHTHKLPLFGFASGIAANNPDCALGPWYLYYHPDLFQALGLEVEWQAMIEATTTACGLDLLPLMIQKLHALGEAILPFAKKRAPFCVVGGDHSSAMGVWSAVAHAQRQQGDIGLVWIDAHMDSHIPETSLTKNIHGMPLAHLLGSGSDELIHLFTEQPALKPEHVCLIGIRSYEPAEEALLKRLGVRIIYIDEVHQRGIDTVLNEVCNHLAKTTCGFGISLDLDGIDPRDAPGVGCPEPQGITGVALIAAFRAVALQHKLLGLEIAEYNPISDHQGKTATLLVELINAIYG